MALLETEELEPMPGVAKTEKEKQQRAANSKII
jgi:hypothetical protein